MLASTTQSLPPGGRRRCLNVNHHPVASGGSIHHPKSFGNVNAGTVYLLRKDKTPPPNNEDGV